MLSSKNKAVLRCFIMLATSPTCWAAQAIMVPRNIAQDQAEQQQQELLDQKLCQTIQTAGEAMVGIGKLKEPERAMAKQNMEQKLARDVHLLLVEGANVDWHDALGWSAIHFAAQSGLSSCLAILLCAAPNTINDLTKSYSTTPLHLAAGEGHLDCVKLLVNAGASVDLVDGGGYTAYQDAVERGRTDTITYLLQQGASPNLTSHSGIPIAIPAEKADAIQEAIRNGLIGRANWTRVAVLIAFMRANVESKIKNSILVGPIGEVRKYAGMGDQEEDLVKHLQRH